LTSNDLTPAPRDAMTETLRDLRSPAFAAQIEQALPPGLSADRFVRVAATAIQTTPELIVADRQSLFASIVRCAQAGLLPDGREAAFVEKTVRGKKVVLFWPMIGGYRKIAAKHGIVLVADVVREGDAFSWSRVPPRLEHVPKTDGQRGEILLAYCVAYRRDWQLAQSPTVMTVDDIERVRAVSPAAESAAGPWRNWWDRMAVKTVARRAFGELPLGDLDELATRVLEADNEASDLPTLENSTTVAEANVSAAIGELKVPDGGVPDDTTEDEIRRREDEWIDAATANDTEAEAADEVAEGATMTPDEAGTLFPAPESARRERGDVGA
jgi:phage RecT family recombinase